VISFKYELNFLSSKLYKKSVSFGHNNLHRFVWFKASGISQSLITEKLRRSLKGTGFNPLYYAYR